MAPLTFVGTGWLMLVLGPVGFLGSFLGFLIGTVGVAVVVVGLARVRWRNRRLAWAFYAAIALLVGRLIVFSGAPVGFAFVALLAAVQVGIAVSVITGVRECLNGTDDENAGPAARLKLVRALIVAIFAVTVLVSVVAALGVLNLPVAPLVLLQLVAVVVNAWLGVLLLQLRDRPALQEHSSRR